MGCIEQSDDTHLIRDFQVLKYPHIKLARNAPLQVPFCIWDNLFFGIPLDFFRT
jgi:hypothetical protein